MISKYLAPTAPGEMTWTLHKLIQLVDSKPPAPEKGQIIATDRAWLTDWAGSSVGQHAPDAPVFATNGLLQGSSSSNIALKCIK